MSNINKMGFLLPNGRWIYMRGEDQNVGTWIYICGNRPTNSIQATTSHNTNLTTTVGNTHPSTMNHSTSGNKVDNITLHPHPESDNFMNIEVNPSVNPSAISPDADLDPSDN